MDPENPNELVVDPAIIDSIYGLNPSLTIMIILLWRLRNSLFGVKNAVLVSVTQIY